MKIGGNSIRPGNIIEHLGKLWVAVKIQHTQPGKGGAYLQVELKGLKDGTKMNERFRSSETVERVFLDELEYQFLYPEEGSYVFMDMETYDQVQINEEMIGDAAAFLKDGMMVKLSFYEGIPLTVSLPDTVVMEVVEADAVIKGQTASSSYKPARLENGLRVLVPPHIEAGTRIVVNTADSSYVERAKD